MRFTREIPLVCAVLCLVGSVLGIAVYSAYVHKEGPIWIVNQFLGVLLASLLCVFSTQTLIYLLVKRDRTTRMKKANLVVDSFVLFVSFLLFLGYCIGQRGDGIAWCFFLSFINAWNVYILYHQYKKPEKMEQYGLVFGEFEEDNFYETTKTLSRPVRGLLIADAVVKSFAILFLVLLLGGAWTLAYGYVKYSPRGNFVHVKYEDGRSQKIHYLCEGPLTEKPTIWLEVGGGHTMCDFYGLQYYLSLNNYRSCIYDRPGFGWSDYMLPNQPYWYEKMINETKERGPFVVAAWGAGGDITYPFVSQNPHLVYSWVLLDVSTFDEEWNAAQYAHNWTDAQTAAYQQQQIKSRYMLFDIIRVIATPLGWMSLFYYPDPATFQPSNLYPEFIWHTKLEKHWTSQYFMLKEEVKNGSPLSNISAFPSSVPIVSISSFMNKSAICGQQTAPLNSSSCDIAWKSALYWYSSKKNMFAQLANYSNSSSTWIECSDCDLGFPVEKSQWTAMTLLQVFNSSSIHNTKN